MAQHFASLSMKNQFAFKCPIFDAEVQMRSCVTLRDKVYRGERVETRRGCQACISSGKCPAAEIVRRIAFGCSDATDHCSSDEPKVGRLPGDVLDRVAPVMIQETYLQRFGVSQVEIDLIATSRARVEAQAATAPREKVEGKRARAEAPAATVRKRSTVTQINKPEPAINHAAATGDLSAALNAA